MTATVIKINALLKMIELDNDLLNIAPNKLQRLCTKIWVNAKLEVITINCTVKFPSCGPNSVHAINVITHAFGFKGCTRIPCFHPMFGFPSLFLIFIFHDLSAK